MVSQSASCSIFHAISTELRAWRHFSLFVGSGFLFIRLIKFLVTRDLLILGHVSSRYEPGVRLFTR